MNSDAELLRQYAQDGLDAAFTELVWRHVDWVYSAAVRVGGGDRELGEDVAQRVFTELARKARVLAERESITGWLHTCTRYTALATVRDERRRQAREREAWVVSGPEDPAPEWERVRPLLDEAVGKLRDGEREAVTLRFFQGKSHREVGAILGMNEEAARKRVERALEKLRMIFARRGVVVAAGVLAETLGANAVQAAPPGLAASAAGLAIKGAAVGAGGGVAQVIFMTLKSKVLLVALAVVAGALAWQYEEMRKTSVATQADDGQGKTTPALKPEAKITAGSASTVKEKTFVLAEAGDLKAVLVVRSPANLADTDWLKFIVFNGGSASNLTLSSYSLDKLVTTVAGTGLPSKLQPGSAGAARNFGVALPRVGKRALKYYLPEGEWAYTDVPSAFAARNLGWPDVAGWQVQAQVKFDVKLADERELATPADGVTVQFRWVRPNAAQMPALQQELMALLVKADSSPAEQARAEALGRVPEIAGAMPLAQVLEALQVQFHDSRPSYVTDRVLMPQVYKMAQEPAVVEAFRAALAARNPVAVDDLAAYLGGPWAASYVEPLVSIVEQGPVLLLPPSGPHGSNISIIMTAQERAMGILDRHAGDWTGNAAITARLAQAVLNANPILVQAASGKGPEAAGLTWWNWWRAVDLLVKTHDPQAIVVLEPYLGMKEVAIDGWMSDNGQNSERVCDVAYAAILQLLGRPETAEDWRTVETLRGNSSNHEAYLAAWQKIWEAQDPKIARLQKQLAGTK